jgi:hypothetical protein
MAVLNVDKVFRFVQFVANKESRGWVSPSEFNIAAELSQIAVYSRLESMFLMNKKIHSDMRPFLEMESMPNASPRAFPTNFRQLIDARISGTDVEVKELTQAEFGAVQNSSLLAPSAAYPKCVVRNDGIYIYPVTVTDAVIAEYISKLSTVPTWAYTVPTTRPVYDSGNSVDFEFEDNLFLEIAMLILANVGMNIKENAVTQYGMAFNQAA